MADPDLELRRGPGFVLLALLAFRPSFLTQNKGCGAPEPLKIHHWSIPKLLFFLSERISDP